MNKLIAISVLALSLANCTAQDSQTKTPAPSSPPNFELEDFYSENTQLDSLVEVWYNTLSDTQRVAQLIMTSAGELGKPQSTVRSLVKNQHVGGVIFLKGSVESNTAFINELNDKSTSPLWYAIDAEPSLFNKRVKGASVKIPKTIELTTESEVKSAAHRIDSAIQEMGFHVNFAPVVDLSPDNEAIKDRSFGSNHEDVIQRSSWFIEESSKDQIMTCVKHFPGHGYVKGDTHKQSVYIDGELKEVMVYPPLFEKGALSVMVAHVAVRNNMRFDTEGKPASCSKVIVSDLLRDSLNFQGIIFTDAMNMMAATTVGDSAPLQALEAGCDVILMPPNEKTLLIEALRKMETDSEFKNQINQSILRVLRAKVCLGLFPKQK